MAQAQSFGGNGRGSNTTQGNGGGFGQPGQQGSGAGTINPGGGGGGGAGAAGGADGDVGDQPTNVGGAAGTSGTVAAPGATNGQTPGGNGGGGGGGGNGILNAAGPVVLTLPVSGGNGGTAALSGGQSGGGGSGGYGVVSSTADPLNLTITLTPSQANPTPAIRGGNGGNGGQSLSGTPGNGGDGGVGVYLRSTGSSLDVVSGSVVGGTGGTGGAAGKGGVGVLIDNGATILNAGAIQGGLANGGGAGAAQANALGFTSGASRLTTNAGGTYGGNFAIATGATLTLDQTAAAGANASATYANAVTGGGAVLVQTDGGRIVTLTGTNTYTGATTVNAGTLRVDGSIASPNVTVNNGGTLSGIGTIGTTTAGNVGTTIAAGGTLAPGNAATPYGTLTVNGPIGFAAGSFYDVNISPTQNSRTNVTGTTTIQGGTVSVAAGTGTYAARQYTILTSTGGVTGAFTGVTSNLAFLTPSLSYGANNVLLNIAPVNAIQSTNPVTGQPVLVPNYTGAASTQNQLNVASGLTQAGVQSGGRGQVLRALNQLTVPQAQATFDSLSGEGITAAQNVANRSSGLFTSTIFDQTTFYGNGGAANAITLTEPAPGMVALASANGQPIRELADLPARAAPPVFVQPNRTWRAWATGFGGVDDIHGNGQIGSAYQQNTIYGGTLGVDYQLMPNYLVGVAIGGTNGDFLVPGRATSGSTTGGHVAIYDLATFGSFYGASSTSFSYFGNRATRTVSGFGGLGTETERANFNSDEFRSRLEFGRHLAGHGGVLTPFVALELAELRSNGFTENAVQGAGLFRLNVSGQSQASAPAFVGVRLQRATSLGNGITLSPTLQVAYVHEFAPYRSQIGTLADLPGSTFLVDGARPARNAAQVKAGAEMAIGARSVIFANFDGEFSGVNQLYAGRGGFRYLW